MDRDMGIQLLDRIMEERGLKNHDLVAASVEPLTHKQVQKGRKGRRLTPKLQRRILNALTTLTEKDYNLSDLFGYS